VALFDALVRGFGRVRVGSVFEGVGGRTQRFTFPAPWAPNKLSNRVQNRRILPQTALPGRSSPFLAASLSSALAHGRKPATCGRGHTSSHGKSVCWQGQTAAAAFGPRGAAKGTLPLRCLGLTDVRKKTRMGRPALGIVLAGFAQAEGAVHRQPDIGGVRVLLPVVFPPAHRAQRHHARSLQRPQSAAWAAISSLHSPPNRSLHPLKASPPSPRFHTFPKRWTKIRDPRFTSAGRGRPSAPREAPGNPGGLILVVKFWVSNSGSQILSGGPGRGVRSP